MKDAKMYYMWGTLSLLFFVILGYTVKFYPDGVLAVDTSLQQAIFSMRNHGLTLCLKGITHLFDPVTATSLGLVVIALLALKKWYAESLFFLVILVLNNGILGPLLKLLYQRARPLGHWLITETGYSFPSGHATFIMTFVLLIWCVSRLETPIIKGVLALFLIALFLVVGFSRIYLGVHYPSDVLAGFLLAIGTLLISYPYFDRMRFKWRFIGRQK